MVDDYPYETLIINNRRVSIGDILASREAPATDFEHNTFDFIRKWFSVDSVFVIRTSGSTGTPKDIRIARDQMIGSALLTKEALDLRPGETSFVCLDTRYIAGQMMLVRSFVTGMKIVASDPTSNPFSRLSSDIPVDFVAVVPYNVYHILHSNDSLRMNSIRNMIIGGAPLEKQVAHELNAFSCACYATYGMTETISHIALQRLNGKDASDLFTTLPSITVAVDDRNCLAIRTPYLQEEIITNDIVELVASRRFRWIGRWDNIINSGGVKISPEEIEEVIESVFLRINLHRRFVISSIPDPALGHKMVLVIEGEIPDKAYEKSLFEHFQKELTVYRRPKEIWHLPFFPQTNTGKIDRNGIKKMLSERPQN